MEIKIGIEQLSSAIMHELEIYSNDVVEGINDVGAKAAKEGVRALRQTSPEKTSKYAKGWAVKQEKAFGKPTRYIIHNKDRPWLAHLLERGHAKRGGGRVAGKPHIKPAEETVVGLYVKGVEEVIKNGGKSR